MPKFDLGSFENRAQVSVSMDPTSTGLGLLGEQSEVQRQLPVGVWE